MSSSVPLIRISPSEFQFSQTKSGYSSRLRLTNLQQRPVGFKFKTNAPHKFLVKPVVCALTKKGMAVDVIVKSTSAITDTDRFLIQTVALSGDEADGLDSSKWRKLDPTRIMEDLIQCTHGRRASISSHGSLSPPASPPLVAVSHVYDSEQQPMLPRIDEKPSSGSQQLAKRVFMLMPGIDMSDWSWTEFALFGAICMAIGFFLPAIRYVLLN
ncbi:hypothetical protein DL89DRAFT_284020 [Linderina pennispora]|uniref:MSP domain-containing protein n=1 Tax=Linderina pennispora TaxID=61395 RepID=A0A1Y1W8B7_9FUNG|nr:uncharacterized protein DL89DRAFT_284020 [Linderina pennispora]ORX69476.1 hypothetical protein DL89DRAFT_284020 [Linderina pennispora]